MGNPFKKGSTQYHDFELMSDLQWHCTKCELKSGQAKTWQVWRQEKGIQLAQDENNNWFKKMLCPKCNSVTIHRKLLSTDILDTGLKARTNIPKELADRIKKVYDCVDEYSLRTEPANKLEIDHRVPQVRWTGNEDVNSKCMTESQIEQKFMLLTRENNLLKSRICEKCKDTGCRGKGYKVIEYWYEGNEQYNEQLGCKGCFWHNPTEWRRQLNKELKKKNENK